jgi:crossover junction endodeoxyribonuclease RuvC
MATRILGIDPGTRVTGFGVIESRGGALTVISHGGLRTPSNSSFPGRLLCIADALGEIIDAHAPTEAAVEDLFHAVNARSALQLAHMRGAILLELARKKVPLFAYAPRSVKKAVTGAGGAGKDQVRAMVERILRVRIAGGTNDVSDALAVAICHAHSRRSRLS